MTTLPVPPGYVGPYTLPTGREVFWTGRVAIGLLHKPRAPASSEWIQQLLVEPRRKA